MIASEHPIDLQQDTLIARPTPNDVEDVRNILLTWIPYEIADLILTEAQYWARISTKRDIHLRVQASDELLQNAKWVYMLSDPIPTVYNGDHVAPTRVKSVKFSLKSCDQGWGGFSEDRNSFRNSYTWFEASILRQDHTSKAPPTWVEKVAKRPVNITTFTEYDLGCTELRSPYRSRNRRWIVQMNAQASRHVRRHEIVWSGSTTEGGAPEPEFEEKTGSGRGLGFVEALQAGDRIALIARALYPGWENNVFGVEMEIAYQT